MRSSRRRYPRCPPSPSSPTYFARSPRPPSTLRPAGRQSESACMREDDAGGDGAPAHAESSWFKGENAPCSGGRWSSARSYRTCLSAAPLFCAGPTGRQVSQVGPDRPRQPVACHSRDCIDERSPRTGAGVRTLPTSLLHRGGLNALFLAAPLPLLEMSPTPRRPRWGGTHPRPHCTARQHVDRHECCSKNDAREATRPPFSP